MGNLSRLSDTGNSNRSLLILLLCGLIALPPKVWAEADHGGLLPLFPVSGTCETCPPEYVFGKLPKSLLIRVRVLGAVYHPGTYYVPHGTDLLTLLTSAGGITFQADNDFLLRRKDGPRYSVFEFNLHDIVKEKNKLVPELKGEDLVYVPHLYPLSNEKWVQVVYVVGAIAAVALAGFAISAALNR